MGVEMTTMKCPECGEACVRDEVDIGVGIQYGPWGCTECSWSEIRDYEDPLLPMDDENTKVSP